MAWPFRKRSSPASSPVPPLDRPAYQAAGYVFPPVCPAAVEPVKEMQLGETRFRIANDCVVMEQRGKHYVLSPQQFEERLLALADAAERQRDPQLRQLVQQGVQLLKQIRQRTTASPLRTVPKTAVAPLPGPVVPPVPLKEPAPPPAPPTTLKGWVSVGATTAVLVTAVNPQLKLGDVVHDEQGAPLGVLVGPVDSAGKGPVRLFPEKISAEEYVKQFTQVVAQNPPKPVEAEPVADLQVKPELRSATIRRYTRSIRRRRQQKPE